MIHLISISFAIIIATAIAWTPQPSPSINSRRRLPQSAITTRQTLSSITTLFSATNTPSSLTTTAVDETYYTSSASAPNTGGVGASSNNNNAQKITLTRWLSAKVQDYPELRDMESLHLSIQMACKTISNLIHSSSTSKLSSSSSPFNNNNNNNNNLRDNSMKRLDQLSKNVLQNALRFTGRLRVVEAPRSNPNSRDEEGPKEHQPGVTIAYALDQYGKVRRIMLILTLLQILIKN